jgi:ligand-binding sensor domain-containing protein
MAAAHLPKWVFSLGIIFSFLSSCNGQTNPSGKPQAASKTMAAGHAKIPKPLGPNQETRLCTALEDSKGNLWFGSNGDGLYRYDGNHFVRFGIEEGLNSNIVYSILEDKAGTIWVGTTKGLNRWEDDHFINVPISISSGNFSAQNNRQDKRVSAENAVWSMIQDRKGIIWLGTDEGVFCYEEKKFFRFLDTPLLFNKDSLQLKGIFSILQTKDGRLWFAECSGEGVSMFDGITLSLVIPYEDIRRTDRIIEDSLHQLWFATAFKGIGKYDGQRYTQNIFKDENQGGSYNILEDKKGHLWFDTQSGLLCYDGQKTIRLTEKDGIVTRDFVPLLSDQSGNIWFSSMGMKLFKFDGKTFSNFSE